MSSISAPSISAPSFSILAAKPSQIIGILQRNDPPFATSIFFIFGDESPPFSARLFCYSYDGKLQTLTILQRSTRQQHQPNQQQGWRATTPGLHQLQQLVHRAGRLNQAPKQQKPKQRHEKRKRGGREGRRLLYRRSGSPMEQQRRQKLHLPLGVTIMKTGMQCQMSFQSTTKQIQRGECLSAR